MNLKFMKFLNGSESKDNEVFVITANLNVQYFFSVAMNLKFLKILHLPFGKKNGIFLTYKKKILSIFMDHRTIPVFSEKLNTCLNHSGFISDLTSSFCWSFCVCL